MKAFCLAAILAFTCFCAHGEDTIVVAHRGSSEEAPENTIPAFELAWKQQADAIEGDFHLTRDGHIVCIHDKDTKRVAGSNLVIKDSSLEQLRALDVGAYRGEKYKGTVIPTIAEVFATIPESKKIYIEIKCGAEIIAPLLNQVSQSKLRDEQIVFISFDKEIIRKLKAKAPQFQANWLSGFKKNLLGKVSPSLDEVLSTLKEINADGFSSTKKIIDQNFIKRIMDEGYDYHVWTVDDAAIARRFVEWGAKSITTNAPLRIREHLEEVVSR